ncbi:MAG: hypothetical protein CMO34_04215 [Verrucomicrobia bacterium]|nr:hypothetical protein [Verrucomicrobiota bacterium]
MQEQILKYLSYFAIFNHPVHKDELTDFFHTDVHEAIVSLLQSKKCFEFKGYLSTLSDIETITMERLGKESVAEKYFDKLPKYVNIIKNFPFVRSVALSGSLSKKVMHQDSDIDYFIITSSGRLWICRTLLVLFKKVFLFNSRKYFCVNYFIDENNLKIIDKNMFTAVEASHLLPVYNVNLLQQFWDENNWINEYFETFNVNEKHLSKGNDSRLKALFEFILSHRLFDRLDLFFMKLTHKRWAKKFGHFDAEKLELTMRSNRGVSKHHPKDFQNKVLKIYSKNIEKIGEVHEDLTYA